MTLKLSFCLKAATTLNDQDLATITDGIEAYVRAGMATELAEVSAVDDMLAAVRAEHAEMVGNLKAQHPDLFKSDRPAIAKAAKPSAAKERMKFNPETDTLLQAVAKMGGIRRDIVAKEFGLKPEELKHTIPVGGLKGYPFRATGGLDMDRVITNLQEAGYFTGVPDDELRTKFEAAIYDELGGGQNLTIQGQMRAAEEAMAEKLDADEAIEREALLADAEDLEIEALTDDDLDFFGTSNATLEAAIKALGFTDQEIQDAITSEKAQGGRAENGPPAGEEASAPGRTGSQEAGPGPAGEGLTLQAQTAADLKEKTERETSATEAERKKKTAEQNRLRKEAETKDVRASADQTGDDFQLGQSAEQQMTGIADLFAAPAASEQSETPPTEPVEAAAPVPEDAPAPRAIDSIEAFDSFVTSLQDGNVTVDQFKSGWNQVKASTDKLRAELVVKTKAGLLRMMDPGRAYQYKNDVKDRIVDAVLTSFGDVFNVRGEGMMIDIQGLGTYERARLAATDKMVAITTQEDLQAFAKRVADARAARAQRAETAVSAMADPKTLSDFQIHLRAKMAEGQTFGQARMSMTPQQRAAFDEIAGTDTRTTRLAQKDKSKAEVRVAGQLVVGDIIETKHTQKGHDLFVVRLGERVPREDYDTLNASAKKLGGYYSSFRGRGATPGFQFLTRDNAEAFVKLAGGDKAAAQEVADTRRDAFADDRSQSAAERLTEMADRLEERADEGLARDRKTNTERRASQAARAEAEARAEKAMATTMRNVAEAITAGKAKFLDRVRQKVQVELLQSMVRNAQGDELRAKYPSYSDQERHKGEAPTGETADYATWPQYTLFRTDLARLGRELIAVDGTKLLGQRLMKVADDTSEAYTKFAKENLLAVSRFALQSGGFANFASKADAETSIHRSGLAGKGIPLSIKRGEVRIVLSPSEAVSRGIWKGDGDKRITLDPDLGEAIFEKVGKLGRRNSNLARQIMPWQFETARDRRAALARMGIETPAEMRAALREFIGMREQAAAPDKVKEMERAMVGRQKDGLDFFPTPASTADEMVDAADIEPGMRVLEPSAGMGHIADRIREAGVEPEVAEYGSARRELLEAKGYNVIGTDFMHLTVEANGQFDRIVMNPPFSEGRDMQHVQHAYTLLKPGGRLVALMGESAFHNQNKTATAFRTWLEERGGTEEKLPDGTFMDPSLPVNTGANGRMVVIEKPGGENLSEDFADTEVMPLPEVIEAGPVPSQDAAAVALIEKAFRGKVEAFKDLTITALPRVRKPSAGASAIAQERYAAADLAEKLFGKRVVFFSANIPFANGMQVDYVPGSIFVSESTTRPMMGVLGHELLHSMSQDHPELYRKLGDRLRSMLENPGRYGELLNKRRATKGLPALSFDKLREELIADIVGDNFTDPAFWRQMSAGQPSLFGRVLRVIRDFLDNLLTRLKAEKPYNTAQYLNDVQGARDAVVEAMRQFANSPKTAAQATTVAAEANLSENESNQTDRPEFKRRFGDTNTGANKLLTPEALVIGQRFVSQVEALAEKHGKVYVRWSPTTERDLHGNQQSRDFVASATHHGLSAVEVSSDTHPIDIAAALAEYGFLRMQDHRSRPHVYLADRVGTDSDGHALIKPRELLADANDGVLAAIDAHFDDAINLQDEIEKAERRLQRITDANAREIVERALTADRAKLAKLFGQPHEQNAPQSGGAFDPNNPSINLSESGDDGLPMLSLRHTPEEEAAMRKAGIDSRTRLQRAIDRIRRFYPQAQAALQSNWARQFQQGALDQFTGIRQAVTREIGALPTDQDPYVAVRLANGGASSVMRGLLMHGQAKWAANGQHLEKIEGTEGLLDILKPLGENLNDFFGWMIGNRAARLMQEGRENNFTPDDIKALQGLNKGKEAEFRRAALGYAAFKRSVLDIAQGAGLLDPESRKVWDQADYIPFYREIDDKAVFGATGKKGLSGQSSGIRTLKGGEAGLNDPMENILMNFSRLIDASLKNKALAKTISVLQDAGSDIVTKVGYDMARQVIPASEVRKQLEAAGTPDQVLDIIPPEAFEGMAKMWAIQAPTDPDVVRIMVGGKPQFFKVNDPLLLKSLTSFVPFDFPGLGVARAFKRVLTGAVTATPEFMARNWIRDTMASLLIGRDGFNPAKALSGVKKSYAEQGGFEAMLFAGASFQSGNINAADPTGTATAMRRALRQKGFDASSANAFMASILDTPAKFWEKYRHVGESIENGNREAIYEATLKAGKSPTAAAYEAKDLMDFTLRGSSPVYQLLADVLPFFNARVQGMYRLGRADPKRLVAYGMLMLAASVALAIANSGNADYDELPDWDKDTYWHFWIKGEHFRIPKPFELGVIFATLPERVVRYAMGQDTGKKFASRVWANIRDQLAFDPVPQIIRPGVNTWANKDTFRDRPIENQGDEGKLPSQRYSKITSATAVAVVKAIAPVADEIGLSPKKLEYLVAGYLGTAGLYALGLSDMAVKAMNGDPPGPAKRLDDYPLIRSFYRQSPATSTVFETDLYKMRTEIEQVYKSVHALRKDDRDAEADALESKNEKLLDARKAITRGSKGLAALNKRRDEIYADREMTPKEKRTALDEVMREKNELAKDTMKDEDVLNAQ